MDNLLETVKFIKTLDILTLIKNRNNAYFKYIAKGNQGFVYLFNYNNYAKIVVKISDISDRSQKELDIMKQIDSVVQNKHNFLQLYGSYKIKNKLILLMEYANYSFKQWLEKYHDDDVWYVFIFQYLTAVYDIQTNLKACHNDLHLDNILITHNSKPLNYNIGNCQYKLPNSEYIFIVTDWGMTESKLLPSKNTKMNTTEIDLCIKNNSDLYELSIIPNRIIMHNITNYYKLQDLIRIIKSHNDLGFESYIEQEKNDINKRLKTLPQYIKDKSLFRSIAYYGIERKYIKSTSIPEKNQTLKIPSEKIINLINNIYNDRNTLNVSDIINKYFANKYLVK